MIRYFLERSLFILSDDRSNLEVMKRIAIIIFCGALGLLALFVLVELPAHDTNAPRFEQAQPPVAVQRLGYDFLAPRPFEGGKMWINASADGFLVTPVRFQEIRRPRLTTP
jgi:hypothetical protein